MTIPRKLLVVGGRQKPTANRKNEWHQYDKAVFVEVDVEAKTAQSVFEYSSPAEAAPDRDPSFVFKAASVDGSTIYACTQTEVLVVDAGEYRIRDYVSLPCFNDLHHVVRSGRDTLLVANTGLDMVLEVTRTGRVVNEWSVLGTDPWSRFSKTVDYRKVNTTKPHRSHPNYVFEADGDIWATRLEQRDAIALTRPGRRIDIQIQRPHDGVLHGQYVYFTTVDGHLVVAQLGPNQVKHVIDLQEITNGRDPRLALGWCRGLHLVSSRHVVVGFSRLRPTKLRDNVRWAKFSLGLRNDVGSAPTRIALYDLEEGVLAWEIDLEPAGLNAVFSIHEAV